MLGYGNEMTVLLEYLTAIDFFSLLEKSVFRQLIDPSIV